jgi:hypothetical protein
MGWAAGFQAGSQVARNALDAYYGAKERSEIEALNQQAPESLGGASLENRELLKNIESAADAQGNPYYQLDQATPGKFGISVRQESGEYKPVGPGLNIPQQQVKYLGREYKTEDFTPEVQRAARTQALTDIVSKYRPEAGVRLGLEAQKASDEAEARRYAVSQRPMAEQLTQAQIDQAKATARTSTVGAATAERGLEKELTLDKAESSLGEAVGTEGFDFNKWVTTQKLPPSVEAQLRERVNKNGLAQVAGAAIAADQKYLDFEARIAAAEKNGMQINELALAREMGLSAAGKTRYFQGKYGVDDAELKANQKYIENKLGNVKNLEQLRDLHKSDPNFDPGQHFDFAEGPDGKVTVRMYDTKTNEPLANVAPRVFKNRDDALASLVAEAKGADSLIAYTATKRKTDLDEGWKVAQTKGEEAKTAYVMAQRDALPAQARVWTEQANHLAAETKTIPGKAQAQIGLMGAQAANARAGANLHNAQAEELGKVKASNLMPLTNATTGDVILVDATKLGTNANGTLQIPAGYTPQKTLTDQQKSALEGYNKVLAGDTSLLEPANAAKREALITSLGLQGIIPVKGINPGAGTDRLGPQGLGAPPPAAPATAAPPPAYSNQNLPITERLSAAYARDSAAGNNYEVNRLREEASVAVPQIRSQIATLKNSMNQAAPAQQASMQAKITQLENALAAYGGLMPQRTGLQ